MQLESLLMMLFFTIVIPIIIMSANHNVFFILVSILLLISAVKEIFASILQIRGSSTLYEETEDDISAEAEMIEELEDATNINIKRFSAGIRLAKNLVIIMFYIYCSLYLGGIIFRLLISSAILYRVYLTISLNSDAKSSKKASPVFINIGTKLLYNLVSIAIVISAIYVKFINI